MSSNDQTANRPVSNTDSAGTGARHPRIGDAVIYFAPGSPSAPRQEPNGEHACKHPSSAASPKLTYLAEAQAQLFAAAAN